MPSLQSVLTTKPLCPLLLDHQGVHTLDKPNAEESEHLDKPESICLNPNPFVRIRIHFFLNTRSKIRNPNPNPNLNPFHSISSIVTLQESESESENGFFFCR